ncbi:protein of unknown function [Candidatus Nitrosocosmicus franklandus]|uniref:Uncharacterized protein n=1 Tax=Candidatus Nitrosocosmicus franklandianus TaxID=1798806 RepID=A0A484IG32_9ARCH|nr:protein of unknown function [Candidatus Nitrosocosmicus franklandus]
MPLSTREGTEYDGLVPWRISESWYPNNGKAFDKLKFFINMLFWLHQVIILNHGNLKYLLMITLSICMQTEQELCPWSIPMIGN